MNRKIVYDKKTSFAKRIIFLFLDEKLKKQQQQQKQKLNIMHIHYAVWS